MVIALQESLEAQVKQSHEEYIKMLSKHKDTIAQQKKTIAEREDAVRIWSKFCFFAFRSALFVVMLFGALVSHRASCYQC